MKPAHIGLEQEAHGRTGSGPSSKGNKLPIKCLLLHECDSFTIAIFCLPPDSIIPLHKLVYGTMHVTSYDWVDLPGHADQSQVRPAKIVKDTEMTAPCPPIVIYPTSGGNMHCLRSISQCAIFDILSPPYSPVDGRHITFFRESPSRDLPVTIEVNGAAVSDLTWLEEIQPHEDFKIVEVPYNDLVFNK